MPDSEGAVPPGHPSETTEVVGEGGGGPAPSALPGGGSSGRPPAARPGALQGTFSAVVIFAVTASVFALSPQLGLTLASLMSVPFAYLMLVQGSARGIITGAGSAIAVGVVAWNAGISSGGVVLTLVSGIGLAVVIPIVLARSVGSERLGRHPLTVGVVAWVVVLVAITVAGIILFGWSELVGSAHRAVDDELSRQLQQCRKGPLAVANPDICSNIELQRALFVGTVDAHPGLVLSIGLAIIALAQGATSLWLLRLLASRHGLPVMRTRGLSAFEAEWPIAYVLATGLMLIMGGTSGDGAAWLAIRDVGAGIAVLAGLVLAADGMGVIAWMLGRSGVRAGMRVAIWVMFVIAWELALPIAIAVAMWDLVAHPRRRGADLDTMDGRGTP